MHSLMSFLIITLLLMPLVLTTNTPTVCPSVKPTLIPSVKPSIVPTTNPSVKPSLLPTVSPTFSMMPSLKPSQLPSIIPTVNPSQEPTVFPSIAPTQSPTIYPTIAPSASPTVMPSTPTSQPSCCPSRQPSNQPTSLPSGQPSSLPSDLPSSQPTRVPSNQPTSMPSIPTSVPSALPSRQPSTHPSSQPSVRPSRQPSARPSRQPSAQPSRQPTSQPSRQPTRQPTGQPTRQPSRQPTRQPICRPSSQPTKQPYSFPSGRPSSQPVGVPSSQPFCLPTSRPSLQPTIQPSARPSFPGETRHPSSRPTSSRPTTIPSRQPSAWPSSLPSCQPTMQPSTQPAAAPSSEPSNQPSGMPSCVPIPFPTGMPTKQPYRRPTGQPSRQPTSQPTRQPFRRPTGQPSRQPFGRPSSQPSRHPTSQPTRQPFMRPSGQPSRAPTGQPSGQPSRLPTMQPSRQPTRIPSSQPSRQPTSQPSGQPTRHPTSQPSRTPTRQPSGQPTRRPSQQPFSRPSGRPSQQPSVLPTSQPSSQPSGVPTQQPFMKPSSLPSQQPFAAPTGEPSGQPSSSPSLQPFSPPTSLPSEQPSGRPSTQPSLCPSGQPSSQPSVRPSTQPSDSPTGQPSRQPTRQPSRQPSGQPSHRPTAQPTSHPSSSVPTSSAPFRGSSRTFKPTKQPVWSPTSSPSTVPTAGPSASLDSVWTDKIGALLESLADNDTESLVVSRVNYYELAVNQTRLKGGCQQWEAFQQGELLSNTVLLRPASISFTVLVSSAASFPPLFTAAVEANVSTVSCFDSRNVSVLVDHINGRIARNTSQLCEGHTWQVRHCPLRTNNNLHSLSVCVDCLDPCASSSQCAASTLRLANFPDDNQDVFTVQPCFDGYKQCAASESVAESLGHILSVAFVESQPAPSIVSHSISTTRSSATLTATLNGNGSLYCMASTDPLTPSAQMIMSQHQGSLYASAGSEISLTVSGLSGVTSYRLYCTSVSSSGSTLSVAQIQSSQLTFTTLCCKRISVLVTSSYHYQNSLDLDAVLISMDSQPRDYSVVTFFGVNVVTGGVEYFLFPRKVIYDVNSLYVPGFTYSLAIKSGLKGTYNVSYSIAGEDRGDYAVVYPLDRSISILDPLNPPPAPAALRAVLSDDLTSVVLLFSTPTDKAGMTSDYFTCSQLFFFPDSNLTTCQWTNSSAVSIQVHGDDSLSVGDSFSLKGELIRARCDGSPSCGGWDATNSKVLTVLPPSAAVAPSVNVVTPSSIGRCDNLTLDLTSSSGSGGRQWAAVRVNVTSGDAASAYSLQSYLSALPVTAFSSVVVIPAALVKRDTYYLFLVTLCNFAGMCGSSSSRVMAVDQIIPSVVIFGGNLRTVSRSSSLLLTSLTSLTYCQDAGDTNIRGSGLTSEGVSRLWSVSINGIDSLSLTSQSKDPAKFTLPSFSLSVGSLYQVTLTSSMDRYSVSSSSSSVSVLVSQGRLHALIDGGSTRYVSPGQIVSLDASLSYDEDASPSTGLGGMELLFTWSCHQTSPVLLGTCSMGVLPGTYSTTSLQQFVTSQLEGNLTNLVTVVVSDASKKRMSQASVSVVAVNRTATHITLSPNFVGASVNPSEPLSFTARLTKSTVSPSTVRLTSSDASVNLTSVALLPVSLLVSGSSSSVISFSFKPFAFTAGVTTTFTLTCSDPGGSLLTTSVVVLMNSPPRPGFFSVSPPVGSEALDSFTLLASFWTDSDVPLSFQFFFQSPSGLLLPLQERSSLSYTSTLLPAGPKATNYSLSCVVRVFDSLLANNSGMASAVVHRQRLFRNTTAERVSLSDFIGSNNNDDNSSINSILSASSLVSFSLNDVDCSKAPDCTSLNRYNCGSGSIANTCGACYSWGNLIGDFGPSNSACVNVVLIPALLNSTSLGVNCTHTVNCTTSGGLPWQECYKGHCRIAPQSCALNCSNHGSCVYQSTSNDSLVSNCLTGDYSCKPVCECRSKYFGEVCEFSASEFNGRKLLREKLSSAVLALSELVDGSSDSLSAASAAISSVAQYPYELTVSALLSIIDASSNVITAARASLVGYEAVSEVLQAVDSVMAAQISGYNELTFSSSSHGRRLAASRPSVFRANDSLNAHLLNTSQHLLQLYGQTVSASMAAGQDPVVLIADHFRTISYSFEALQQPSSGSNGSRAVSVESPLTWLEQHQNLSSSRVRVLQLPSEAPLRLSAVLWSNQWYSNPSFLSDSLQLHFDSSLPCDTTQRTSSSCEISVEVAVQNHLSFDYSDRSPAFAHAICSYDDFKVHQYRCPSGLLINASCNGSFVELASRCDYIQPKGVCNSVLGVTADHMHNGCNATSFDSFTTVCSCPIVGSPPSGASSSTNSGSTVRRLGTSAAPSLLENVTRLSGGGSGHFVSVIDYHYMPFEVVHIEYVPDTSEEGNSWKVLTTVGGLLAAMVLCVSIAYRNDLVVVVKKKSLSDKATERQSVFYRNKQQQASVAPAPGTTMRRARSNIGPVSPTAALTAAAARPPPTPVNVRISTADLKAVMDEERKYQECPEMRIVDQALPHVYRSSSFQKRVFNEMKQFHRYLNLIFVDDKFYARLYRMLSLTTNIICFLFVLSIVYTEVDPNDRYCESLFSEEECLKEADPFGTGYTRCRWDPGFKLGSCHFNQPTHNRWIILFATVFSVIVSSPLVFILDYTIQHTLAVPTKKFSKLAQIAAKNSTKTVVQRQHNTQLAAGGTIGQLPPSSSSDSSPKSNSSGRGSPRPPHPAPQQQQLQPLSKAPTHMQRTNSAIKPGQALNVSPRGRSGSSSFDSPGSGGGGNTSGGSRGRTESMEKLSAKLQEVEQRNSLGNQRKVVNNPFNMLLTVQNIAISTEKEDITTLLTSLREFRETLSGKRKKIFDDRWGLEPRGGFVTKKQYQTGCCESQSIDILRLLTQDLKKTRYELTKEIFNLKKYVTHNADRKRRILYLFMKDLTYGVSSQVLDWKQSRETLFAKPILASSKVKGWVFVLGADFGMLVYIYYFAVGQSTARQSAWFKSLLLWLVMDCIFVSTLVTFLSHIFVPLLIKRKVAQVKQKLIECMKEFNKKAAKAASVAAALKAFNDMNGTSNSNSSTVAPPGFLARGNSMMRSIQEEEDDEDEEEQEEGEAGGTEGSDLEAGRGRKSKKLKSLFKQKGVDEGEKFNTARTLFLSYRVAEEFTEYRESRIVMSFVAIWPIKSYLHKRKREDPREVASRSFAKRSLLRLLALYKSAGRWCMALLSMFLFLPVTLQDFLLYDLVFLLFGIWMLLHLVLFDIYPAYALIPTFVFLCLIHFIIVSSNSSSGDNLAAGLNVNEDHEFDTIDDEELAAATIEHQKSTEGENDELEEQRENSSDKESARGSPTADPAVSRIRRVANVLKPRMTSTNSTNNGNGSAAAPAHHNRATMLSTIDRITNSYAEKDKQEEQEEEEATKAAAAASQANGSGKGRTLAAGQLDHLKAFRDRKRASIIREEDEEGGENDEDEEEDPREGQKRDRERNNNNSNNKTNKGWREDEQIEQEDDEGDDDERPSRKKEKKAQREEAKMATASEDDADDWMRSILKQGSQGGGAAVAKASSVSVTTPSANSGQSHPTYSTTAAPSAFTQVPSPSSGSFSLSRKYIDLSTLSVDPSDPPAAVYQGVPPSYSFSENVRDAPQLVSSRFPSVGTSFDMPSFSPRPDLRKTPSLGNASIPSAVMGVSSKTAEWALSSYQAFSQKTAGGTSNTATGGGGARRLNISTLGESDSDEDEEPAAMVSTRAPAPVAHSNYNSSNNNNISDATIPSGAAAAAVKPSANTLAAAGGNILLTSGSSLAGGSVKVAPSPSIATASTALSTKADTNFLRNSSFFSPGGGNSIRVDSAAAKTVSSILFNANNSCSSSSSNNATSNQQQSSKTANFSSSSKNNKPTVSAKQKAKNQSKAVDRLNKGL